jgi:hypothetical protein
MSGSLEFYLEQSMYLKSSILERVGKKHIYILDTRFSLSDVIINAPFLVRLNESAFWGNCDLWVNNSEIGYYDQSSTYKFHKVARMATSADGSDMLPTYPEMYKHSSYFIDPANRLDTINSSSIQNPMLATLVVSWFHKYTNNKITLLNGCFSKRVNCYPKNSTMLLDNKYSPEKDEEFLRSLSRVTLKTFTL